jgi:hypothetical protein
MRQKRFLSPWLTLAVVLFGFNVERALAEPAVVAADSQLLSERFDRIRRSSKVTIFHVDGWARGCLPWTFPKPGVIDCHPIVQEVSAPSKSWRDSVVALVTAPGALVPPRAKLCVCQDDVVLRFTAMAETTTVWACTTCGTIGIPTPVSVMGFDLGRGLESFQALIYATLPKLDYLSRAVQVYYEEPPVLFAKPDVPPALQIRDPAWVDSVVFEARIGKDGRVSELQLKRGVPGLDSLAAAYVSRYRYKSALSRNRPVAVRSVISLRVPSAKVDHDGRGAPRFRK